MSAADDHEREYQRRADHCRRAAGPCEEAETTLQPVQILSKAFEWIHAIPLSPVSVA